MAYKTYNEQLSGHLCYLRSHGLEVTELQIDSGWIRCHPIGISQGRGELAYISTTEKLNNGFLGIKTSLRGLNGPRKYSSYGQWPNGGEQLSAVVNSTDQASRSETDHSIYEQAARRAYGFWQNSSSVGFSDYLNRKGVGSYGIRFRSSEQYGNVAVIPMFDIEGRLWSYQLLNPDGTKRHPKEGRIEGLFHLLLRPFESEAIGIAESYATAATCMQLSGIPVACAFSCHNLSSVAWMLKSRYPNSKLIIFADNDRHLDRNQGLLMAQEVQKICNGSVCVAAPDFGDCRPSKEASDWNDFFCMHGEEKTREQILYAISKGSKPSDMEYMAANRDRVKKPCAIQ